MSRARIKWFSVVNDRQNRARAPPGCFGSIEPLARIFGRVLAPARPSYVIQITRAEGTANLRGRPITSIPAITREEVGPRSMMRT